MMTKIDALYDIVYMHSGTGNTTWIFEQAKRNPMCRILFLNVELAKEKEKEYVDWFTKINKRQPNKKEIPHFCGFGDLMVHSVHGLRIPLIIDNSCFQQRDIEEIVKASQKEVFKRVKIESQKEYNQKVKEVIGVISKLSDKWYIRWFPKRKRYIESIIKKLL